MRNNYEEKFTTQENELLLNIAELTSNVNSYWNMNKTYSSLNQAPS